MVEICLEGLNNNSSNFVFMWGFTIVDIGEANCKLKSDLGRDVV